MQGLKYGCLAIFITALAFAKGQEIPQPFKYRHQVGLNTTVFVKQFIAFSNNNLVFDNPYLLTYKYIGSKGGGLRSGFGLAFVGSKNTNSGGPSVPDSSMNNVYVRLGYEKQVSLTKHWIAYAGADVRYEIERSRAASTLSQNPPQVSTITSKRMRLGGGPVLGMEFVINNRLSLNVEAALLYFYTENRMKVEDTRFPTLNTNNFDSRNTLNFSIPSTVFFVLKL